MNVSSIALGAVALSFAGLLAIRDDIPLILGTFTTAGGIVGGIQWLYLRNVIKDAYLWVLAMVWCGFLWGYFFGVFFPATVRALS
jgi:hypothetical protein